MRVNIVNFFMKQVLQIISNRLHHTKSQKDKKGLKISVPRFCQCMEPRLITLHLCFDPAVELFHITKNKNNM